MFGFSKKAQDKEEGAGNLKAREDLTAEKTKMIRGVEDLSVTCVKEVMVPRVDVDFLSSRTDSSELFSKIAQSGHSRFPVFDGSIDNVTGVLYVKDIIQCLAASREVLLEKIVRKPYFVPESKRIDTLLREFKRKHIHIAIVIDEYGGVSGIVCMEDIIEEIVGDIQDEFDNEREDVLKISSSVWICDGRVNLDDVNEETGATFPAGEFDTLGGFVFDLFGKIPVKFEKVSWNDWDFIIQDMDGHKIELIKLVKKGEEENIADAQGEKREGEAQ